MFFRLLRVRYFPRPEDIGISKEHPLRFVASTSGVVHIGAHTGEEAWIYNAFRRSVLWIEANPHLMPRLKKEIQKFPGQTAVQALLTEAEGDKIDFLVTNNDGASSSILQLSDHKTMYPEVVVTETIALTSSTLSKVLEEKDPRSKLNCLVIDVQGAELAVLRGAGERLRQFNWIYAECADFELYKNGCTLDLLRDWLSKQGFSERMRHLHKTTTGVGSIYDVLFERL